jgi:hypothetical protein
MPLALSALFLQDCFSRVAFSDLLAWKDDNPNLLRHYLLTKYIPVICQAQQKGFFTDN